MNLELMDLRKLIVVIRHIDNVEDKCNGNIKGGLETIQGETS